MQLFQVLTVLAKQAPVCDFESILHNVMAIKPLNKMPVDLCVDLTGVTTTSVETGVRKTEQQSICSYLRVFSISGTPD